MKFPRMFRVRQLFRDEHEPDPRGAARRATDELLARSDVHPGQTVAMAAGSRGVANIADIFAGAVEALRERGVKPCGGVAQRPKLVVRESSR